MLSAVADHLRASSTRFFFGPKPTSLDALLFGHLAFYRYSPAAAPVLQSQVGAAAAAVAGTTHQAAAQRPGAG